MEYIDSLKNLDVKEQYQSFMEIVTTFFVSYKQKNSWKLRLIDSYIVFCFVLFIIQMVYVVLNGLYPMNAFISGIICCVGSITFALTLRFQVNPQTKVDNYSNEKVFAEYIVASLIFYFVCINFLG